MNETYEARELSRSTSLVELGCDEKRISPGDNRNMESPLYSAEGYGAVTSNEPTLPKGPQFKKEMVTGVSLTPRSSKRVQLRTSFVGYLPDLKPLLLASPFGTPMLSFRSPAVGTSKKNLKSKGESESKSFFMDGMSDHFGLIGSAFNLCSATLGAGVLSIPYAFKKCGLIISILLLVIAGLATILSIDTLVESSVEFVALKQKREMRKFGSIQSKVKIAASYEEMSVKLLGKHAGYVVETCIIMFCFGTATAYIIAVGDILEQGVINNNVAGMWASINNRESAMILFWVCIMFPLSLLEKINSLRCASVFGVLAIFYLVFVCVFHSIKSIESEYQSLSVEIVDSWWENNDVRLWPESFSDVLLGLPIFMFAFSCQVNVISIYEELEKPSLSRMRIVTYSTVAICLIAYLMTGIFSYLEFGKETMNNILINFCVRQTHDPMVVAAFVSIIITVVMAFPLNIFPCRYTVDVILARLEKMYVRQLPPHAQKRDAEEHRLLPKVNVHTNGNLTQHDSKERAMRHILLTFLIAGSALFVALIVPNISVVFAIMGGTASAVIGFILPGMFALKLDLPGRQNDSRMQQGLMWTLMIGGAVVGTLTTTLTVYNIVFDSKGESAVYNCNVPI